jgi:hypothetical protein
MQMKKKLIIQLLVLMPLLIQAQVLKISSDNRYIETIDGKPFFWLADTAWELFHRLNREDAMLYLKNRAEKDFTVIKAVILAELDGLNTPNAYGDLPLNEKDPARPNEKYFKHVDFIVNEAEKLGLVVGMLPTWGDKVTTIKGNTAVIFNTENAFIFGEFLGKRYKDKPVVWILGGDRNIANKHDTMVWRAMAAGIKKGDGGRHLISYHPRGGSSSHTMAHNEEWLDFNMYQSGHTTRYNNVYNYAEILLETYPRKPFLEGEPAYEDIPVNFGRYIVWKNPVRVPEDVLHPDRTINKTDHFRQGFFNGHDVRVHAYWNLLAGSCGYTYGNNAVWQMFEKGGVIAIPTLSDWREALDRPGAETMRYVRKLFEARPFHMIIPAQQCIAGENPPDSLRVRAAIARDNSFLLAYASVGQELNIDLSTMRNNVVAWWYNPRNGEASKIGKFKNSGNQKFSPPSSGAGNDWMLVIDDKKSKFGWAGQ